MAYLDNVTNILQIQPDGMPTVVRLSQNENGRRLYFRLVGNEDPIPSGVTVTISGTKPDGVVYSASGSITNDVVLINESTQMTAVAGTWDAKIKIVSSGQTIATGRVRFEIDADPVAPGSVPSDSELEGLVAEAQAYAENARSSAYGSPLTASTVAGMTDHTRVYVYTGSETGYTAGNWYYWNGSAWTSGGVYNSTALQTDTTLEIPGMAADSKATGDAIDGLDARLDTAEDDITDVKSDLSYYTEEAIPVNASPEGWKLTGTGACTEATSYKLVKYLVTAGDMLHLTLSKDVMTSEAEGVYQWQNAAGVPSNLPNTNLIGTPVTESVDGYVIVPEGATYLIVSQFKTNTTNKVMLVTDVETVKEKIEGLNDDVVDLNEKVDNLEPGLSDEAKEALMACFANVSWADTEHGQEFYDALYEALYGISPDPEVPTAYTRYDYIRAKKYEEVPEGVYSSGGRNIPTVDIETNKGGLTAAIFTSSYSDLNALNIKAKIKTIDSTKYANQNTCPFGGGIDGTTAGRFGTYFNIGKQWAYIMSHGQEVKYNQTFSGVVTFEIINGVSSPTKFIINGTEHSHPWVDTKVLNCPISFLVNRAFTTLTDNLYGLATYVKTGDIEIRNQNNELISKLIPVVRKDDNRIGIWDSVRREFYTTNASKFTTIGDSSCIYAVGSWDDVI